VVGGCGGGTAFPKPGVGRGSVCGAARRGSCGGGTGAARSGRPGWAGRCGTNVPFGCPASGPPPRGGCGGDPGVDRGAGRSWRCCGWPRLRRSSSSFDSGRCAWAPLISVPPARPIHAVPTRAAVIATGSIRRPKPLRSMFSPTFALAPCTLTIVPRGYLWPCGYGQKVSHPWLRCVGGTIVPRA
jgi:hypothetical protein